MSVRVALNGFGRIGRNVFRAAIEAKRSDIEFVAINDLGPPESNAHLLRFDSVHGTLHADVAGSGNTMTVKPNGSGNTFCFTTMTNGNSSARPQITACTTS